jgi:ABC-2 type transport system ATP-binding protein
MKILTGYHFPSGGQVKIDGVSVEEDPLQVKQRIGYLPESNPLYGDLNPEEYLNFAASARLLPGEERRKAVNSVLAACGLGEVRTQRIESLSKGYKQRVGLAQAIIHDPPILILDEPTSGLDPNQIIEIRSLIRELGKRKTVILSTHILQEVEAVCSGVLILNEGRITAMGTPDEIAGTMKAQEGFHTWELELKGVEADIENRLAKIGLPSPQGVEIRKIKTEVFENSIVRLSFEMKDSGDYSLDGERIFDWAISQGGKIIGMNRKKLSLEDIFVKLTSEPVNSEPLTSDPQTSEHSTQEREK